MKRLNIEIDEELFKKLKYAALYEDVSMRVFLTRIIYKEILKREKVYNEKT